MIDKIFPNIFKIELPLPGIALETNNAYYLSSSSRNLLIDTGLNHPKALETISRALGSLEAHLENTDIFLTHFHADHAGLASSLATEHTRIFVSRSDAGKLINGLNWDDMFSFATLHGFPQNLIQNVEFDHPENIFRISKKPTLTLIDTGQVVRVGELVLETIGTPGHTNGHLCLYERNSRLFFSGDHILENITPNIQLWSNDENPVGDFLTSLAHVYDMSISSVLPGHQGVFKNCRKVILELKEHHQKRSAEILSVLKEHNYRNSFQLASKVNWDVPYSSWEELPAFHKWLATGEVIAHVKFLERQGHVKIHVLPDSSFAYSLVEQNMLDPPSNQLTESKSKQRHTLL
jgi:glyoxylase-like metal-dependent hydrolase (beta-lactamase superfamily II)